MNNLNKTDTFEIFGVELQKVVDKLGLKNTHLTYRQLEIPNNRLEEIWETNLHDWNILQNTDEFVNLDSWWYRPDKLFYTKEKLPDCNFLINGKILKLWANPHKDTLLMPIKSYSRISDYFHLEFGVTHNLDICDAVGWLAKNRGCSICEFLELFQRRSGSQEEQWQRTVWMSRKYYGDL